MYTIKNSSVIYISQKHGDDARYNGLAPVADKYGNGPFKSLNPALRAVRDMRAIGDLRPMTLLKERVFLTVNLLKVMKIQSLFWKVFMR